jgi:hypothetical protein
MALQLSAQTAPNHTVFSPNATDPCMRHTGALLPPLEYPGTAYIAIGPVANFTALFQSCCPNKTPGIQNYYGGPNRDDGDAPRECYYYCAFNGSYAQVEAALNCSKCAAEGEGKGGVALLGASPDWPKSAGRRSGAGVGVWKWVVLGLVVGGAGGL